VWVAILKGAVRKKNNFFRQQIGRNQRSFVRCWNWDTLDSRSEIPGRFLNVVLEEVGKEDLDRSCER
jgi:hypothetical protein